MKSAQQVNKTIPVTRNAAFIKSRLAFKKYGETFITILFVKIIVRLVRDESQSFCRGISSSL